MVVGVSCGIFVLVSASNSIDEAVHPGKVDCLSSFISRKNLDPYIGGEPRGTGYEGYCLLVGYYCYCWFDGWR